MIEKTGVLIIGGGICGTSIARELSKYDVDVTLVEKEADVGWGQTKASYGIRHPGARWTPGTLVQQMIAEGNQMIDQLIKDLDIEFRRLGELVLSWEPAAIVKGGSRRITNGLKDAFTEMGGEFFVGSEVVKLMIEN